MTPDKKMFKRLFFISGSLILVLLALEITGHWIGYRQGLQRKESRVQVPMSEEELQTMKLKIRYLRKKITSLSPRGVYLVIDTSENKLSLKKNNRVLREAVVSCGSGNILQEPRGKRQWVFDTPRGVFSVASKLINPSWLKPDWAFIEETEVIPKDKKDRIEVGVLGDYALGFGNGYFIHGTLYTRLLGRNVTHGCIRVGDKDLEAVYKAAVIGTKIYIF